MNSLIVVGIFLISLVLGGIKYRSIYSYYDFEKDEKKPRKNVPWELKFAEIWNDSFNFFVAGLIGYYFALIRLPLLLEGQTLVFSDFILFVISILGTFGHLCVMSLNITKGIEAILKRVLER